MKGLLNLIARLKTQALCVAPDYCAATRKEAAALLQPIAEQEGRQAMSVDLRTEDWFCPSCGQAAKATISALRLVECRACKWVFDVRLYGYIDRVDENNRTFLRYNGNNVSDLPAGRSAAFADKPIRKL